MELEVLERAVEAAETQLQSLRFQLGGVTDQVAAVQEFLARQAKESQGLQQQERGASELEDKRDGNKQGQERENVGSSYVDESLARKLDILQRVMEEKIGLNAERQELSVSKALASIPLNKPRADPKLAMRMAYSASGSHPYRLTVFGGANASICSMFNVDENTQFHQALHYICEYLELDDSEYCLQANHSVSTDEYLPYIYGKKEIVVKCLERLKYDVSKGFGCSGIGDTQFSTEPFLLPPLYLVSVTSEASLNAQGASGWRQNPSAPEGNQGDQGDLETQVNVQLLKRLFLRQNRLFSGREDHGFITFEQFTRVVHDYFEGYFFERHSLNVLFHEKAHMLRVRIGSPEQPVIGLQDCEELLENLLKSRQDVSSISFGRGHLTTLAQSFKRKKGDEKKEDAAAQENAANGAPLSPESVFDWMIAAGKASIHADSPPGQLRMSMALVRSDEVSFPVFREALSGVVHVDTAVLQTWWSRLFGAQSRTANRTTFEDAWGEFASIEVVAENEQHSGRSSRPERLEDILRPVVRRFEVEQSQGNLGEDLFGLEKRRCVYFVDLILSFLGLLLAYSIVFSYFRPESMGSVTRAFQKELQDTAQVCLNTTDVVETGRLQPEVYPNVIATDLRRMGCVWGFIAGPLLRLYYENFLSGQVSTTDPLDTFSLLSTYQIVPMYASIRLLRVKNDTVCNEIKNMPSQSYFTTFGCLGPYNLDNRETEPMQRNPDIELFGGKTVSDYFESLVWQELSDMDTVHGEYGDYDGSGYVHLFGSFLDDDSISAAKAANESLTEWLLDVKNLMRLSWIDSQTRAIIINVGLINQNVELYTNVQVLVEISAGANIMTTMSANSFDPRTAEGSGLYISLFLRSILLVLMFGDLVYLTRATVLAEKESTGDPKASRKSQKAVGAKSKSSKFFADLGFSQSAATRRLDGGESEVVVEDVFLDAKDEDEGALSANKRLTKSIAHAVWRIFTSHSLFFTLFIVLWIVGTFVTTTRYIQNQQRANVNELLPVGRPWNGLYLTQEYGQIATLDACLVIMMSVKVLTVLHLAGWSLAIFLQVLKAIAPYLWLTAFWLFPLIVGFAVSSHFITAAIFSGVDFSSLYFFLQLGAIGLVAQNPFDISVHHPGTRVVAYLIVVLFNLFVAQLFAGVVLAVYYYEYTFQFLPRLRKASSQQNAMSTVLGDAKRSTRAALGMNRQGSVASLDSITNLFRRSFVDDSRGNKDSTFVVTDTSPDDAINRVASGRIVESFVDDDDLGDLSGSGSIQSLRSRGLRGQHSFRGIEMQQQSFASRSPIM